MERRTRSDFLFLFMSSCLAISLLFASPRFVQNSYKCRAFHSVCMVAALSRRLFPYDFLPSLLVCTHLSIRMHHPSIHPSDHRLRFLLPLSGHPFFFLFYSAAVCRSCWCWIIDAQLLLLLRCHQDGRICTAPASYYMHSTARQQSSHSSMSRYSSPFDRHSQGQWINDHRWSARRSLFLVDTLNEQISQTSTRNEAGLMKLDNNKK